MRVLKLFLYVILRIILRIIYYFIEKLDFSDKFMFLNMSRCLKKYNVDIYLKDEVGIIKRLKTDNFEYIFKTGNSCDAVPMIKALNPKINNLNVSFDIGANIGITTIWLAKNSQKVYAFEPVKSNLERMSENLRINNVINVEIIPQAVSNINGISQINLFESYGHHSLGLTNITKFVNTEKIQVTTLDNFCEKENIDYIDCLKIDVEGFEQEVLEGAKNLLSNKKINLIILEVSQRILNNLNKNPDELFEILNRHNYVLYDLSHNKITRKDFNRIKHADVYAVVTK